MTHQDPAGGPRETGAAADPVRVGVERALISFLARQREVLLSIDGDLAPAATAIESFVLRGGKRLRPQFAYWGFVAAGGEPVAETLAAAAALELVQASALMHDDLMDASDTRRGEPSIHRRFAAIHRSTGWAGSPDTFGAAAAILLGDLCLCWSDELLHTSGLDPSVVARARPVFDQMRTEVTAGQYLDVLAQATSDMSVERASKIARFKSGKYTVEQPLLFGAALAGAGDAVPKALSGYGLPLGEAFQLRDDILGVFGDPAVTGKPAGDDLREGKRTFLVAAAAAAASPARRRTLIEALGDPALKADRIAVLREIIVESGALVRTEQRITDLTAEALASLDVTTLPPIAVNALTALAHKTTRREG